MYVTTLQVGTVVPCAGCGLGSVLVCALALDDTLDGICGEFVRVCFLSFVWCFFLGKLNTFAHFATSYDDAVMQPSSAGSARRAQPAGSHAHRPHSAAAASTSARLVPLRAPHRRSLTRPQTSFAAGRHRHRLSEPPRRPESPHERKLHCPKPWELPVKIWRQHAQQIDQFTRKRDLHRYATDNELAHAADVGRVDKDAVKQVYADVLPYNIIQFNVAGDVIEEVDEEGDDEVDENGEGGGGETSPAAKGQAPSSPSVTAEHRVEHRVPTPPARKRKGAAESPTNSSTLAPLASPDARGSPSASAPTSRYGSPASVSPTSIQSLSPQSLSPVRVGSARRNRDKRRPRGRSPPLLSPQLTRTFTNSGADQLRRIYAEEKMREVLFRALIQFANWPSVYE